MTDVFNDLKQRLDYFVSERDWDQFHSPKNLTMVLFVGAAELVEHFQRLTQEESAHLSAEKRADAKKRCPTPSFISSG